MLCEARLLREGLRLREDLLPASHASSRPVLWSQRPVRLQALLCLRGLRSGEGLLRSGTGLLQARLLRSGSRLLCPGSGLLQTSLLRPGPGLLQTRLLREGLRL